jgi:hypothetical protein
MRKGVKDCANVWNIDCNGTTHIYKKASNSINKIQHSINKM